MDELELVRQLTQDPDDRMMLRKLLDKRTQARRGSLAASRFLTDREQALARTLLARVDAGNYLFLGGYPEAERALAVFCPDWMEPEDAAAGDVLQCLRLTYRPEDAPGHRDILGALMGLGITRDCIGDILISPQSADVLLTLDVAEFVARELTQVGRSPVKAALGPPDDLRVPEQKYRALKDTVASPRLDSVLSVGCSTSREKAAALIRQGLVQVDHAVCTKPDRMVSEGEKFSVRGFGKLQLKQIGTPTRKGRYPVVVWRFE